MEKEAKEIEERCQNRAEMRVKQILDGEKAFKLQIQQEITEIKGRITAKSARQMKILREE